MIALAHGTTVEGRTGLRERAVRLVQEHTTEHGSQWEAIRSVGERLGCSVEALRRWVRQAEYFAQAELDHRAK